MKYLYGLTYKNRDGKNTNMSYRQYVFTCKRDAGREARALSPLAKKKFKVMRLVMEKV